MSWYISGQHALELLLAQDGKGDARRIPGDLTELSLGSLCASVIFTSSTLVVAVIDGQSDFVFAQSIC